MAIKTGSGGPKTIFAVIFMKIDMFWSVLVMIPIDADPTLFISETMDDDSAISSLDAIESMVEQSVSPTSAAGIFVPIISETSDTPNPPLPLTPDKRADEKVKPLLNALREFSDMVYLELKHDRWVHMLNITSQRLRDSIDFAFDVMAMEMA